MEKLILQKYIDYSSDLNFVDGQIASDGSLVLVESDLQELDFFRKTCAKKELDNQDHQG